jgi:hypothetical protein
LISDQPYIYLEVSLSFLLFSPSVTSFLGNNYKIFITLFHLICKLNILLEGKVTIMSSDHISLLVYGIFNAYIPKELIPSDFTFEELRGWFSENDSINVGAHLTFQVVRLIFSKAVNFVNSNIVRI